jgi:hypothetical protein
MENTSCSKYATFICCLLLDLVNNLTVGSRCVYRDNTVFAETFLGCDCLKTNSSKYENCQTTRQESTLFSEVHAFTPLCKLLEYTTHRLLSLWLCEETQKTFLCVIN